MRLKVVIVAESVTNDGSAFQTRVPATGKARSPTVVSWCCLDSHCDIWMYWLIKYSLHPSRICLVFVCLSVSRLTYKNCRRCLDKIIGGVARLIANRWSYFGVVRIVMRFLTTAIQHCRYTSMTKFILYRPILMRLGELCLVGGRLLCRRFLHKRESSYLPPRSLPLGREAVTDAYSKYCMHPPFHELGNRRFATCNAFHPALTSIWRLTRKL